VIVLCRGFAVFEALNASQGESTRSVTAYGSGTTGTRIVIDDEPLGPGDLRIAREAFDGAWQKIADLYDTNSAEAARERLAKIIVSLLADSKDPAEI
jgi:hypothetical protein